MRRRVHWTIEEKILSDIDSVFNELRNKGYHVSKSDIANESLIYGLPMSRVRRRIGNKEFDKRMKEMIK
jgi:hypothetical protein